KYVGPFYVGEAHLRPTTQRTVSIKKTFRPEVPDHHPVRFDVFGEFAPRLVVVIGRRIKAGYFGGESVFLIAVLAAQVGLYRAERSVRYGSAQAVGCISLFQVDV